MFVVQFSIGSLSLACRINSQTNFVGSDELGNSLDSVDALMRKLDDFEKTLAVRNEKTKALDSFAQTLKPKK